jgi:hypothetical protein
MSQAAFEANSGQRVEAVKVPDHGAHKDQGATSELHAQMDAFRATLKGQSLVDQDFAGPDAKSKGKLDHLHKDIDKSISSLTDLELTDAKNIAHKVNEERKAHHGHSDTLDALKDFQLTHKSIKDVGKYNAVVLGAAAESGGHVNENRYFPAEGGHPKSNEKTNPVLHSPEDVAKHYTIHPVKPGLPQPID